MKGLITSQYDGQELSFNEQGWFNATQAASKLNKSVHEWARLPDTQKYIDALIRKYGKIPYLKLKSIIANMPKYGYIDLALSKISKLALVGYNKSAHIVRSGLFLCVFFLCARISMARLEGEALALASYLIYWSTNPFQLCHHYLVVIGKASVLKSGAH